MAFYDQLGSFFVGETEEERRRREEEEAAKNAVPFKQTIVTDPVTGKQTMKMEGAVEDFTAANPNTPTVVAPVAPEMGPPRSAMMPQEQYVGTPGFNPAASPVMPQAPVTFSDIRGQEVEMQPRVGGEPTMTAAAPVAPTATAPTMEGVMAGPPREAMMPPAAPVATGAPAKSQAQLELERIQQGQFTTPPAAEQMGPPTSAMTDTAWADRFISAQKDSNQMAALQADPNQPEWLRRLAAKQNYQIVKQQEDQQQVENKVTKAIETGDMLGLAREIKKSGEQGSIIKAYLYSRFGLNDLAKQEQEKLGAGLNWQTSYDSKGTPALIQYSGDGLPLKGFDATGKELSADQLAGYSSGASQKAFMMPSVHGSPVVKEVVGPDGQKQQVGGVRMYDPRTKQYYVQTSSGKEADVGWVTTGQAPTAVYTAAGAKQQGTQAAQGFQNQPLPGMPGGVPSTGGQVTTGGATGGQVTTGGATGGQAVVQTNPNIPSASATAPAAGGGMPVFKQQKESERTTKRSESFDKIIDTEYREGAAAGEIISNNRKTQFQILDRVDPASGKKMGQIITGIYNADNEHPGDQKWTMVRDLLLSKTALPEDEISKRVARLNLSPEAKSALIEYIGLNGAIAAKTLKETAGPGSVSDAEQQANRARNVDIGKTPMLGTYNMMAQSQFDADIQRYKADLAASPNNTATNATQFDRDFRRTQSELVKTYRQIAEKRIDYMRQNGFTPDAIRDGYKKFPVPEYDPTTGNWKKLKPLAEILK